MKTRKIAMIVYHEAGRTRRKPTTYTDAENLAEKVFNFEAAFNNPPDVFLVHDVANGLCLHWNSYISRACFVKGRINTSEAVAMMLQTA